MFNFIVAEMVLFLFFVISAMYPGQMWITATPEHVEAYEREKLLMERGEETALDGLWLSRRRPHLYINLLWYICGFLSGMGGVT